MALRAFGEIVGPTQSAATQFAVCIIEGAAAPLRRAEDFAVMAGAPFLPASRDTIFAPASGAGRAAIAVIRVSGPRCAAALAALAPGKAFPDRVATLATLARSRQRRNARPRAGRPLRRADAASPARRWRSCRRPAAARRSPELSPRSRACPACARPKRANSPGARSRTASSICPKSRASPTSSTPRPRRSGARRCESPAAR